MKPNACYTDPKEWEQQRQRGRWVWGFFLLVAGGLLLAREIGYDIPYWVFSWKTFLIALGLGIGIKHRFRKAFWLIPFLIGVANLTAELYGGFIDKAFILPVVLICVGLFLLFRPRKMRKSSSDAQQDAGDFDGPPSEKTTSGFKTGPEIELNAILGGIEKSVVSKNFRKGEINAIMGGAEIDFSEADFQQQARLEINAVLGGIKLVIPSNWEIRSELNCIMGGVEDKRTLISAPENPDPKILLLEGNVILGGIEIRNA
jgi:predicted membrane protein